MLGGGVVGDGVGRAGDRVIKIPAKRATNVLRMLLDDYKTNSIENETYHNYYDKLGKDYFYQMLKPLADLTTLSDDDFVDWGHVENYEKAIGVGECAGVVIDLVATLLFESDEKLGWANESYNAEAWADAIYHSYNVFINSAKALLLDKGINSSTQVGIIREFDAQYISTGEIELNGTFNDLVLQINKNEPSQEFAAAYKAQATAFLEAVKTKREAVLQS
jgi:sulfite reductase (ferredoxin)